AVLHGGEVGAGEHVRGRAAEDVLHVGAHVVALHSGGPVVGHAVQVHGHAGRTNVVVGGVGAVATVEDVRPGVAVERVRARPAVEHVGVRTAGDLVVAGAAVQLVVAGPAGQGVV